MLQQCSPVSLTRAPSSAAPVVRGDTEDAPTAPFRRASDTFARLPMFFMDFYGSTALEDVLHAMRGAAQTHGIQHVVLDNLQFMLSGQERSNFDKYDLLDKSIAAVRSFVTRHNVHVTLVIHPRKEDDDTLLGLSSVLGTSKATQEADNVIILQKVGATRFLDIKKNRHDGELGKIYFTYDRDSLTVSEIPRESIDEPRFAKAGPKPHKFTTSKSLSHNTTPFKGGPPIRRPVPDGDMQDVLSDK